MRTVGNAWQQQLDNLGPSNHDSSSPLVKAVSKDEDTARAFFSDLRAAKLQSYIDGAVRNQQRSLTLEIPGAALGTNALQEFSEWAKSQQLDARIVGLISDNGSIEGSRLALLLRPAADLS